MKAVKGNKEYNIEESAKEAYRQQGFDIYENGVLVEYGAGKTVSLAEYEKVKQAYESVKRAADKLKEETEVLRKENQALDEENRKLKAAVPAEKAAVNKKTKSESGE